MKKKLQALLQKKEERKRVLADKNSKAETKEELRSIYEEIEVLNTEISELRSMIDAISDEENPEGQSPQPPESPDQRNQPVGTTQVLGTYGGLRSQAPQQQERSSDRYDSAEYRSAFMDYVTKGVKSDQLDFRADATTGTGDIGAVLPTTILNRIVEKMKDHGRIWARVTKTSIQGGVEVPLSNAKPTATWVAAGTMSDKQKKTTSGKIVFSYHKLQCRVAVELVAGTVAMPVFEQTVTDNIYEAIIVALEEAVINGSGTGQPLGITKDTNIPASQVIEVTAEDLGKYGTWPTIFGKLPRKYRNGASLILPDADWTKYIEGMTDANGQPVARVTYGLDGTIQEKLLGKEAIVIEDYLPSIDDAVAGEVVGILCKLSDYMVNSNMQMYFKKYFNEDTDEWISKATLIADGKMSDRNGVVLIKKKATV
jgi:HK97 family phage major capsid protein